MNKGRIHEDLRYFQGISSNLIKSEDEFDRYYVTYKTITLSCILFMFIEMKFIHFHSCVMFTMKFMSMCND